MCMTTALCIIPFFKSKIWFPTNLIEKTNLQCGTRTRFVRDIIFNINSFRCCKFCCGKFEQSWRKNVQKIAHSSSDMLMTENAWSYSCILFIISANQKLAVNIKTARVINISYFFSIFLATENSLAASFNIITCMGHNNRTFLFQLGQSNLYFFTTFLLQRSPTVQYSRQEYTRHLPLANAVCLNIFSSFFLDARNVYSSWDKGQQPFKL